MEAEGWASAAQDKVDASLREQTTPGYAIFNIRGGIHHKRLNVALGIENLLNRFYYDHLSYQRDSFRTGTRIPDPGRTVYLNVSVPLP
jgi:iron complex outermembrane receptor protein